MYHFVYKTTNRINGKYYIGKHSCTSLTDSYLGSGTIFRRAVRKYGSENFCREILEFAESEQHLSMLESVYVTADVVSDPNSYNLTLGGSGSTSHLNQNILSKDWKRRGADVTNSLHSNKKKLWGSKGMKVLRERHPELVGQNSPGFGGKTHTEESRRKIGIKNSILLRGENNPWYGCKWMKKGDKSIRIHHTKVQSYLENGWIFGR